MYISLSIPIKSSLFSSVHLLLWYDVPVIRYYDGVTMMLECYKTSHKVYVLSIDIIIYDGQDQV